MTSPQLSASATTAKAPAQATDIPDVSTIGSSIEQAAAKDLSEDELEQALGRFEKCLVVG